MLSSLVETLPGTIIAAPSYRLATAREHSCPANLQDVFTVYLYLTRGGYAPERILFSGDSSGGNLGEL